MKSIGHEFELANSRLLLRPFRASDAEAICDAVLESKSHLAQWLSWCHAEYSIQDSIQFLTKYAETCVQNPEYSFAITDHASGQLLGAVGLNQIDPAALRANLGYWLRASATKGGVATDAVLLVAPWAFRQLRLERIEIVAATGNHASQRVAERVGARREGIARRRLRVHGIQHDAVVFSLVPDDFARRAPA